jgi:DNA primase
VNDIKRRLEEYLRAKGIKPNEQGLIKCLWHEDESPSCKVNDEYLYCFTCNEHGDIYTAAAALLGVPCDREHFPAIARDVEKTLGITNTWQPPKRRPGEPRIDIKLSQSAVYRSELLKEFAHAIDDGNLEAASHKASLLLALFMLPEGEAKPAPEKPKKSKGMTIEERMAAWGPRREAWTL